MTPGDGVNTLEDQVRALLNEALQIDAPAPGTDLIDSGLLDSLGLVTLITEIEVVFGFEVPLDELDVDRFRSVAAIAAFVAEAQAQTQAAGVEGTAV